MMDILPGISGNGVEHVQWESGNLHARFPFADDCPVPGDYPLDAIVDMCVVVPEELRPCSGKVYVGCLHIGLGLVSVMVYLDGSPILFCSVARKSFVPFSPVVMEPVSDTCSGFVTFGDVRFDDFRTPRTFRDPAPLSDSAVIRPVVGRLRKFIQPETGEEARGDVGIVVPEEVSTSLGPENGDLSRISFSGDGVYKVAAVSCNPTESNLSMPVAIKSINGVYPDENGRVAIVFARSASEVPA